MWHTGGGEVNGWKLLIPITNPNLFAPLNLQTLILFQWIHSYFMRILFLQSFINGIKYFGFQIHHLFFWHWICFFVIHHLFDVSDGYFVWNLYKQSEKNQTVLWFANVRRLNKKKIENTLRSPPIFISHSYNNTNRTVDNLSKFTFNFLSIFLIESILPIREYSTRCFQLFY